MSKVSLAIILLIIINVFSMAIINIPVGGEPVRAVSGFSTSGGGGYGKLTKNKWRPLGHVDLNHIPKEQHFRRCDRIKDRFRELLFV